ncbi:MAG: FMN-binding protein [Firmicutes bacterium]|nr:FMN-binding protein [Bacillota bacterium]
MRESLRLIVVLGLIATISGGVLAYVHQTMSPIIEANKEAAMREAILEVLPGAVSYEIVTESNSDDSAADVTSSGSIADATSGSTTADATSSSTTSDAISSSTLADTTSGSTTTDATSSSTTADATSGSTPSDATSSSTLADTTSGSSVDGTSGSSITVSVVTTYRGIDDHGNTTGIAFAVDGDGFGGTIRMMVGLDPTIRKLTRIQVLDHQETPGLGARITEQGFLEQFKDKSLDDAFAAKQDVDAIAGATVSSQAVAATIKAALSEVEADLRAGGVW